MKSIRWTKLVLVLSYMTCNAQEKIYFPYFEMINTGDDAELQYAASKLLKTYFEENHDYHVILPRRDHGLYPAEDFLESIENAKKYEAKYLLPGEINNIGSVVIIFMN